MIKLHSHLHFDEGFENPARRKFERFLQLCIQSCIRSMGAIPVLLFLSSQLTLTTACILSLTVIERV